jgi:hypothetical protein
MHRPARHSAHAVFIIAACCTAPLQAADPLLQSRPCGPDSMTGPLRLLVPQGAFGADFRPACRSHDACYDTPYADRSACDKRYLEAMQCSCEQSRHPVLCRMVARAMYRVTSRHGEESFHSAQTIALQKIAAVANEP